MQKFKTYDTVHSLMEAGGTLALPLIIYIKKLSVNVSAFWKEVVAVLMVKHSRPLLSDRQQNVIGFV